jgi:hypothetical protein
MSAWRFNRSKAVRLLVRDDGKRDYFENSYCIA